MKSIIDPFERCPRFTGRTATATRSAPEASWACFMISKDAYLPVPTMRRDWKVRPPMVSVVENMDLLSASHQGDHLEAVARGEDDLVQTILRNDPPVVLHGHRPCRQAELREKIGERGSRGDGAWLAVRDDLENAHDGFSTETSSVPTWPACRASIRIVPPVESAGSLSFPSTVPSTPVWAAISLTGDPLCGLKVTRTCAPGAGALLSSFRIRIFTAGVVPATRWKSSATTISIGWAADCCLMKSRTTSSNVRSEMMLEPKGGGPPGSNFPPVIHLNV